ncbi:MAG TPA: ester cyclase [Thermoanaerobaculia bacterium]
MLKLRSRAVIALITGFASCLLATTARADLATIERNKAVARRVFDEIFNQKRLQAAEEIYAPDFINHGLHRQLSLAEDQAYARSEVKAFPDLKITVDAMVAEGDYVTVLWTFRGTHTEWGYGGLPPTGTRVEMRGITIWRVTDGKLHDEWTSFNALGAYMQVVRHLAWLLIVVLVTAVLVVWQSGRWFERTRLRSQRTGSA